MANFRISHFVFLIVFLGQTGFAGDIDWIHDPELKLSPKQIKRYTKLYENLSEATELDPYAFYYTDDKYVDVRMAYQLALEKGWDTGPFEPRHMAKRLVEIVDDIDHTDYKSSDGYKVYQEFFDEDELDFFHSVSSSKIAFLKCLSVPASLRRKCGPVVSLPS